MKGLDREGGLKGGKRVDRGREEQGKWYDGSEMGKVLAGK